MQSHTEQKNHKTLVTFLLLFQTSHATQWALYSLAKNPECQERLAEEINQNVPKGETVSDEHIERIPYLMWVVRETLR